LDILSERRSDWQSAPPSRQHSAPQLGELELKLAGTSDNGNLAPNITPKLRELESSSHFLWSQHDSPFVSNDHKNAAKQM
jgi:hypothetical protein